MRVVKPEGLLKIEGDQFTVDGANAMVVDPISATLKMGINTIWSLSVDIPYDLDLYPDINHIVMEESIFIVDIGQNAYEASQYQLFRIYNVDRTPEKISCDCNPIFLDCNENILQDVRAEEKTAGEALQILFDGTGYTINYEETTDKSSAYWQWMSMMSALNGDNENSFTKRWGGEFYFDNYNLIWRKYIDRFRGVPYTDLIKIEAGFNMTGIQYTVDTTDLVTEIWPQSYNGHHYMENSKYVGIKSSKYNQYAIGYPSVVTYDNIKLKEDASDQEEDNVIVCDSYEKLYAELKKAAENDFTTNEVDIPKITYDVDFNDISETDKYKGYEELTKLYLGDSVYIHNDDLNIDTRARIIEIDYDCVNKLVTNMVLGDYEIDYVKDSVDATRILTEIINTEKPGVKGESVVGVQNGQDTQIKVSKDEQHQGNIKVLKFEDAMKGSDHYGAISFGTQGLLATKTRLKDNSGWDWSKAVLVNEKGTWYGKLGNAKGSKYIVFDENGLQSYDGGVSGKGITGTFVGDSFHVTNGIVTGQTQWKPITYELSVNDNMLTLADSNGNAQTVKIPETKTIITGDKGEKGDPGAKGDPGRAGTVTVGTVTTGSAGTNAIVTNSGTSNDAIFNFQIPKGDKGDSLTIKSYAVEYQEGTSSVEAPIGAWMTKPMDILQGNYLWTRITLNFSDGTTAQYYSVARQGIDGIKGATGKTGDTGKGVKSVTHFYLATGLNTSVTRDSDGWTTDVQLTDSVKKYLWTYSKTLWTDNSTTVTDPVIIGSYGTKGDKGDTGPQGNPGAKGDPGKNGTDGVSPTVSVSKSNGVTTISITDKSGTHTQTVSDGTNGTPGAKGADGKTSYFHVKYSNDGGKTFTGNSGEDVGTYIGTCTDYNSADPTTVSSYTWARIKGDTGAKGDPGTNGKNGEDGISVASKTMWYQACSHTKAYISKGRNLLVNSSHYTQESPYTTTSTSTDNYRYTYNDGEYIFSREMLRKGTEICIQAKSNLPWSSVHGGNNTNKNKVGFFVAVTKTKSSHGGDFEEIRLIKGDDTNTTLKGKYTLGHDGYIEVRLNTYSNGTDSVTGKFWDIKVEIGDTWTDWSPAFEDDVLISCPVGNRNLVEDTSNVELVGEYPSNDYIQLFYKRMTINVTEGTYILSFQAKSTVEGDCIENFFYGGGNPNVIRDNYRLSNGSRYNRDDGYAPFYLSTEYKKYWVKYTITTHTDYPLGLIVARLKAGQGTGTVSIKDIKLEYGGTPTDWSPAPEDLGWSTTTQKTTDDKKYLWAYEETRMSDDTTQYTSPIVIGTQGPRGPAGASSFLHIAYANSNDGKIGFSHTWSKSKTWVGHYVTDTNEADSDDPTKYTWVKWVGDDGIGITDIIEYYNVNNSATTAPTSWSTTVQQPNATNRYLWNYEEIKFSSGESHKSAPRIIGVYSNSITKITPYYYLSNSRDTFTLVSGHSWTTTIPNISDGEYLWEKMIVTFDNGSTKETEPVLHGEYNALSEGMNIISSNVDSQIDNAQDHILQQVYSTYATKDALNEYKASMNTQFGVYDGKISANISELNSVKSNVAGLTETANNVNNYMTFDKNGLSLGKSDSDFKTNITNEKLAFLQNGNEVAYFANNQMYVTDGNFANSMTIGKFAFVPRENGSLDFKKVGK